MALTKQLTKQLTPQDIKYIAIHCSATPPSTDVGVVEIDRWHRTKGFLKIGYHYVIRRNGRVETGRQLTEMGAHVAGFNHESIGICLVGGVRQEKDADGKDDVDGPNWDLKPENNFTPHQWAALAVLVKQLQAYAPNAVVQGHRDFPGVTKACPCFSVRDWLGGVSGNLCGT
jgi:N-acetylmuramoyl-L-alanine amidase